MRRFLRNQSLSLVVFLLFITFLVGQSLVGHQQHNQDQQEHGQPLLNYTQYLGSSHFLEATMEKLGERVSPDVRLCSAQSLSLSKGFNRIQGS